MTALGDFFPNRINLYVPEAKYAADVRMADGFGLIDLGPAALLPAADPNGIIAAEAIATAQDWDASEFAAAYSDDVMGKFGRCLSVDGSAASTAVITIYGYDYLGQPMIETITMNGTTAVNGKKAFRRVTRITTGTDADATLDVGWIDILGLPYALRDVYTILKAGVEPADADTIVKEVLTDPQTATTGDPRGTISLHANNATDGVNTYAIAGLWNTDNLYGVPHYNG